MQRKGLVPLTLAALAIGFVLLAGCGSNHNPVITGISVTPADSTVPGGTIKLKVTATDSDGDALTFTWTASAGVLSGTTGDSVIWTAPATAGYCTTKVVCADGNGGVDEDQKVLNVRAWRTGNVEGDNTDSTRLGNPGTITVEIDLASQIPAAALVDSARMTAKFEPDTLDGEVCQMWLIAPDGTEILVWDHRVGQVLEMDDELVPGAKDEPASGIWKLKVSREVAGEEGYTDEFSVDIFYRY